MQDLWADFAGEALPTEEARRGGGGRQQRLSEQAVLMALRVWLLQDYMLPYCTSLGATRIFKRCYWLDGLGNTRLPAQPAPTPMLAQNEPAPTRKRGRQQAATSTMLLPPALQPVTALAQQLARLDRPITLHGLLLDEKQKRVTRKSELSPPALNGTEKSITPQARNGIDLSASLTLPKEGGLLPACWSELAPTLLEALEQSAAVFLLNPLKDGLFRYSDLAPLYQRAAPTELLLWLPHKQIETRLLPSLRTTEGAAALTNLLRGDRWKTLITREAENPQRIIHGLVELLAESMRPHFLTVQSLIFPMRSGPATVETAPYSLLFATRRQDSLYSLNDAVCLRARHLLVESQQGVLNEAWFTAQREEQAAARNDALAQETLALGRVHRVRRWPDLRQQLLLAHFGQHTLSDYDQVIIRLLARGEVRCEWRKHTPETGEIPIPTQDDLLSWR